MMQTQKKIFILDNSKSYLFLLQAPLEEAGFEVMTDTSADRAMLKIINWNPDILVTGVEVGNINGFEVCLILKMIPILRDCPLF